MSDTFWAIRKRELAKHEPVVKKGKKAKKAKAAKVEVVEVIEPEVEPESNDADVTVEPA